MKLEIRHSFDITLGGESMRHDHSRSFGEEIIGLLDVVWTKIRATTVRQNGINIVVYGPDGTIFAGVEMSQSDATKIGLASRIVALPTYGYFKHIGPYSQIHQTCAAMSEEITRLGKTPVFPIVEIYGHWNEDESKLETEIIHAISA